MYIYNSRDARRTGEHEAVLVVAGGGGGVEEHGVDLLAVALQPVHHHLLLRSHSCQAWGGGCWFNVWWGWFWGFNVWVGVVGCGG